MKILKINFKNINSLEGESRIDFDLPPLAGAGVFAITGPNGSGKTSVLDAITLGLYGETYRFDRPSDSVMTKHTTECFSEVEFALGEQHYRSSWRVRRQGNKAEGELLEPEMQLLSLNGGEQVIEQHPNQVLKRINELTGMDFRRFTRSIVLAQGDFAAFLNALDSERLDILEKIIGADVYADFKNDILQKSAQAKDTLDNINRQINAIELMTPGELEAREQDLADFQAQLTEFREQQNSLQQQQNQQQKQVEIETRIAGLIEKEQQIKQQAERNKADLDKIAASSDALVFKDDVAVIEVKNQETQRNKQTLGSYLGELGPLQNQLKVLGGDAAQVLSGNGISVSEQRQSIENLQHQIEQCKIDRQSESGLLPALEKQLAEKQSVGKNVSDWLAEHQADGCLVDSFPALDQLKKLRNEHGSLQEKQKAFAKWKQTTTTSLQKNQSVIDKLNKKIKTLSRKCQVHEIELETLAKGYTLEQLQDKHADQLERIRDFQALYNLARVNEKISREKFSWFGLSSQDELDADELREQLKLVNEEIDQQLEHKDKLAKQVAYQELMKTMQQYRQFLKAGEPCPLCGSLEHPHAEQAPPESDSKQQLTEQQETIKVLQQTADKLIWQIAIAEKTEHQDKEKQQLVIKTRSQWLTLCTRLNQVRDNLDISNTKLMGRLLRNEQGELKEYAGLINQYKRRKNKIIKLQQNISMAKSSVEQLQSSSQQLDKEWKNRPQELIDLEALYERCQQEEQALSDKILEQLTAMGEKMPNAGQEGVLIEQLNVRRQDYLSHSQRDKDLQEEIDKLMARAEDCQTKIKSYEQRLANVTGQLQEQEVAGLHLAIIEKQKLIADMEQQTAQLEAESENIHQAFEQKRAQTQYKNVDEICALLALIESKDEIEQQLAMQEAEMEKLTVEREKNQAMLETERSVVKSESSTEEIVMQLRGITEKMDIAEQEVNHLQDKLSRHQTLQQQFEQLIQQQQEQEKTFKQCELEVQQLTEQDGITFRRKVQKKMADRLLQQSNQFLEKISGRYYVRQLECEHGLALEIEDTKQQNSRRQPRTLSGGESFVVSLALALGLSELANNGKSVDSLFLDEGFGTLDPNTLASVVNTLEDLQTHGKIVGVISHVEAVRKRFKTQIIAVKKANGLSELKVPTNVPVGKKFIGFRRNKSG